MKQVILQELGLPKVGEFFLMLDKYGNLNLNGLVLLKQQPDVVHTDIRDLITMLYSWSRMLSSKISAPRMATKEMIEQDTALQNNMSYHEEILTLKKRVAILQERCEYLLLHTRAAQDDRPKFSDVNTAIVFNDVRKILMMLKETYS